MAGLLIKEVPQGVHQRLKDRAAANRRSMAAELLVILEEALEDRAGPPTLAEIDGLRSKGSSLLTQDLLDEALQAGRP